METFEFNTPQEAWNAMVKLGSEDKENMYSVPYSSTFVVIKRTKEEYSPKTEKKAERPKEIKCVSGDLPEYISPITGKPVDGRYARREELKRHGCREVDPSEFKVEYKNQRFIEKHGIKQ